MDNNKSREALIEFLDYLAQKGLMAPATVQARKASVNTVLGILDNQEAHDVSAINLDAVMDRFTNLQGKAYNPQSLRTYKSRVKSALDDFLRYVENPLAFKPKVQVRERKLTTAKSPSGEGTKTSDGPMAEVQRSSTAAVAGPMASSILPIPIRADLTIYIQGLPFDLSEAEAKKIANVVQAMAMTA